MKDAKSIYRGGDIVDASDCDFESSRKLGLICPFCSEAVYLRSGGLRHFNGESTIFTPSFCHYPNSLKNVDTSVDCERRSTTPDGIREIEKIKSEKRNQRLELYNLHLWSMIVSRSKNKFDELLKKYRSEYAGEALLWFRAWVKDQFLTTWGADFYFDVAIKPGLQARFESPSKYFNEKGTLFGLVQVIKQFSKTDFHFDLCREIIQFVRTRTGELVFENLADLAIALVIFGNDGKKSKSILSDEITRQRAVQTIWNDLIILTPWEAQIARLSNPDHEAASEQYCALLEKAKEHNIESAPVNESSQKERHQINENRLLKAEAKRQRKFKKFKLAHPQKVY